jgi:hypothetical protein
VFIADASFSGYFSADPPAYIISFLGTSIVIAAFFFYVFYADKEDK